MKKIKKIVAIGLAGAMILGMSLTVYAGHTGTACRYQKVDNTQYCSYCGHGCGILLCNFDSTQVHARCGCDRHNA